MKPQEGYAGLQWRGVHTEFHRNLSISRLSIIFIPVLESRSHAFIPPTLFRRESSVLQNPAHIFLLYCTSDRLWLCNQIPGAVVPVKVILTQSQSEGPWHRTWQTINKHEDYSNIRKLRFPRHCLQLSERSVGLSGTHWKVLESYFKCVIHKVSR
jgi:hypothetical protein